MNKTVYVIGAGASQEAGLPTGDQLKKTISRMLDMRFDRKSESQLAGDFLLSHVLQKLARESDRPEEIIHSYVKAARQISKAMPLAISIDNYIDCHPDNDEIALCGKLAIVRSILGAEKNSRLTVDTSNAYSTLNPNSLDETWYVPFFKLLTENCQKDDLEERLKSVALIIFNYDRCIEHFLYHALRIYYKVPEDEATRLINCMNIYHPYGSVGSLPWSGNDVPMEFGDEPIPKQLLQLTEKIKTFTEGTDPESSEITEIRNHMNTAHKLVFLGFAFHKLNMKLINPGRIGNEHITEECYASTYGISVNDTSHVEEQIRSLCGPYIRIETVHRKCAAFFSEFWKGLAF